MSIRLLFLAAAASSAVAATLVGMVYAWPAGGQASGQAATGANAATVYIDNFANLIGPPGSPPTKVGEVVVRNDGDWPLVVSTAAVTATGVNAVAPGGSGCSASQFTGSHGTLPPSAFIPPNFSTPAFEVFIAADTGASNDCQGDTVFYRVDVTLTNP